MRLFLPCLVLLLCAPCLLAAGPAEEAWRQGQAALEADRAKEAMGHFAAALRVDPAFAQARLSMAAAHLALGEEKEALPQLKAYLELRPEHFLIRMHYSELLYRLEQLEEAGPQLERVVRDMQEYPRLADEHLVGCHTRLMEIARDQGDAYGENLHRGIGLYLLARKRAELGDERGRRTAEEMLCKAAAELTLARLRRPDEARPYWYLHGVWAQLAQRQPALKWLRRAEETAPFSAMTPSEKRDLYLACSVLGLETGGK
jgi:tetratricopeptide (TPR) repeat protein